MNEAKKDLENIAAMLPKGGQLPRSTGYIVQPSEDLTRTSWVKLPGPKTCAALVKAQKAAHAVHKGSKNDYHRYAYASAEAIISESRAPLAEAGLAVLQSGWKYVGSDTLGDRVLVDHGKETVASQRASGYVEADMVICHDSGEVAVSRMMMPVIPEKGRPLDKAVSTALTYLMGYGLRGLLNLPRVEKGSEVDQRSDNGTDKPASSPPQQDKGSDGKRDDGTLEGRVEEISEKVGKKKDGSEWVRYGIAVLAHDGNRPTWFSTFSKSIADKAGEAKESGVDVRVLFIDEGYKSASISTLELLASKGDSDDSDGKVPF